MALPPKPTKGPIARCCTGLRHELHGLQLASAASLGTSQYQNQSASSSGSYTTLQDRSANHTYKVFNQDADGRR